MGLLDPALYTEAASPRNEPAELIVLIQIRDKVLYTVSQGTHHPLQILLIVSQLTQGTLHCLIFRLNVCVPVRVTLSILSKSLTLASSVSLSQRRSLSTARTTKFSISPSTWYRSCRSIALSSSVSLRSSLSFSSSASERRSKSLSCRTSASASFRSPIRRAVDAAHFSESSSDFEGVRERET